MTHSTHFIYGYMASDMVTGHHIVREETHCRHMGYSFRLAARVFSYAPPHRQDSTYHGRVTPVGEHWLEREEIKYKLTTNNTDTTRITVWIAYQLEAR